MRDPNTHELEVCWLHVDNEFSKIENRHLDQDTVVIHSLSLSSVFRGLGKTSGINEVVKLGTRIDAVLVGWDATLAPQIGRMKSMIRPDVPLIALDDGSQPDLPVLAKLYWADDVLASPPQLSHLKAAIMAHNRSLQASVDFGNHSLERSGSRIEHGPIVMDTGQHTLTVQGQRVRLSVLQFDLLRLLITNPGDLMTRDVIMERVWGMSYETTSNPVDVFIHHIRNAFKPHDLGKCIQTVRGRGYRFVPPSTTRPDKQNPD